MEPNSSLTYFMMAYVNTATNDAVQAEKNLVKAMFGNSHHLWMWDIQSLADELQQAGFKNVRACKFDDSSDPMFKLVEDEGRFWHAAAIDCTK